MSGQGPSKLSSDFCPIELAIEVAIGLAIGLVIGLDSCQSQAEQSILWSPGLSGATIRVLLSNQCR